MPIDGSILKKENEGWSKPINAGDRINSDKNEYYISCTEDGTIIKTLKMNRKTFLRFGGLGAILGLVPGKASAYDSLKEQGEVPNPQLADNCKGKGIAPTYKSKDGYTFELENPGDPWHHSDGCLGLKNMTSEFDADLKTGYYTVSDSIKMRVPASIRGKRSGFGNPNGEYPPKSGTCIQFEEHGIRIGRPANLIGNGTDDRISLPIIENLSLLRNPLKTSHKKLGDGAAIWTDFPSDQLTIQNVNITCSMYGLLNTSYIDAFRIRGMHTGRVTYPIYFSSEEEAGQFTASWYGTVSDCCFADGDGPVVLQGTSQPWNFSNVIIVRQGRKRTDFPACNIFWGVDNGRFDAGVIDSPGTTFKTFDGSVRRNAEQIDADGMILHGQGNTISTIFKDAFGKGKANLRLMSGSNRNIIQSQFAGTKAGAVDLIIEEGCEDNLVYVVPGMKIIDKGKGTKFIGKEWAEIIEG